MVAAGEGPAAGNVAEGARLVAGVNLPVFAGAWGHDLATNPRHPDWGWEVGPLLAYRYLSMARVLGFGAVRIWLCENGEGVRLDRRGRIAGVAPELLDAVRVLQHGAAVGGMQLYWSLLDANSWDHDRCPITRSALSDPDATARFAHEVAAPLAEAMDPATVFALEVVNEPESLSAEVRPDDGLPWPTLVTAIRTIGHALRAARPGIPVTAGTQAVFLPGLACDGELPVDAVDVHVYHPTGGLPSRADLPVGIGDRPLIAGECGTAHTAPDPARTDYLTHYLWNARSLGYAAAFLWKLDDVLVRWRKQEARAAGGWEILPLGGAVQDLLTRRWRP